jgi:hypothetical protein
MNATIANSVSTSSTQVVVQHDTVTAAQGVKVTYAVLEQLVVDREAWEGNAFRTSNEQLYVLLQKCYQFYKLMGAATTEAEALRKGLNDYINLKGYKFAKTTHTLAKVVKCVFGVDRRRVSAYSIALVFALSKNIQVLDIPAFIRDAGGVEELRLNKASTAMSAKQKAMAAAGAVSANALGVASGVKLGGLLDGGKIGTQVVLIGTWQADGSVVVGAIVESESVLNAALASHYSAIKTAVKAAAVETKAANDASAIQVAIENAAKQAA